MFQRNELRVERRRRELRRGRWRRRGEQSMAKDKERMAEAGELEKEKKRMHHCSDTVTVARKCLISRHDKRQFSSS